MSDRTVTAPHAPSPAVAESTIAAYLESWNETDPARRQAAIARAWGSAGHQWRSKNASAR